MTAVIGILNKHCAAIAADSAVTVTGYRGVKIFNRANKIFRLSAKKPVGIMIYNNGDFMETPWEIIIKQYRSELSEKSFSKLEDYKKDFIDFLHKKSFYCDSPQQKKILHFLIQDLLGFIWNDVTKSQEQNLMNRTNDAAEYLGKCIEDKIKELYEENLNNKELCIEFSDFEIGEFDKLGYTGLKEAINICFIQKGIPISDDIIPILKQLVFLILKSKKFANFYTGLVFTGFGEEEVFPSIISIKVSLSINTRLRWYDDNRKNAVISHSMSSAIRPFAQTDVIDTILSGIDPGIFKLFIKQFENFIVSNNETIAKLIDSESNGLGHKIRSIDITKVIQPFSATVNNELKKNYINPMMSAINTLSKEDLAEMAESLIYLTYLKRRFTFTEESVGGPVDVAIITKGDGFIWIKRKHYFRPDLNPHYFKL
jgi:hypothetical protein